MSDTVIDQPVKLNFKLYRGNRWPEVTFEVVDENDDPVLGFIARMQIRRIGTNQPVAKEFVDEDGFIVEDNKRTFYGLVDLPLSVYVHDLQITLANGKPFTPRAGRVTVKDDTTKTVDAGTNNFQLIGSGYQTFKIVIPGGNAGVPPTNNAFPYVFPFNLS